MPQDWLVAVRTGAEITVVGWLLAVLPALAVYATTSSMDAAAALSMETAMRTGTALWALALGGTFGSASDPAGAVSLPLLGLTALIAVLIRWSVRRLRPSGLGAGALVVLTTVLGAGLLVTFTSPSGSRTWPAVAGLGTLTAVLVAARLVRDGLGPVRLRQAWQERPDWVGPALALTRTALRSTVLAVCATGAVAVVAGAGRVWHLHDSLVPGGLVASAGLWLLQLAWLPTMGVWTLAWLAGPGFVVGADSLFSADRVVAGAVPAAPVLGLLPTQAVGGESSSLGAYVPLVLTVVGLGAAWLRRGDLAGLSLRRSVTAAAASAAVLAAGGALACLAASGSVGPGRMTQVGASPLVAVYLFAELGVGLMTGAVLAHPTTVRSVLSARQGVGASPQELADDGADAAAPTRLVVLVSGAGSNLAAILEACQDPAYGAQVVAVVADKECAGLGHARGAGVPVEIVPLADYADRQAWDRALTLTVMAHEPELIVCAGFMRLLGAAFLDRFEGRVVNTHPSLLPDYPGAHAVRDALADGATRAGATLFWVDEGVDTGAHIAQVEVPILPDDDEDSLTERIKAAETPQLVEYVGRIARGEALG